MRKMYPAWAKKTSDTNLRDLAKEGGKTATAHLTHAKKLKLTDK